MSTKRALSKSQLDTVLQVIKNAYPPAYADASWDNTGLLIDCSVETSQAKPNVLLTVDLTASVAQEAIEKGTNLVVAYHPFIFPSWKSINPWDNTQHRSAISLIQHGISVYCPHTSVDAASNGVNDWLARSLVSDPWEVDSSVAIEPVKPVKGEEPEAIGYGRLVRFQKPLQLSVIIANIKNALGISHVQVATKTPLASKMVSSVALCAGSGSGVFKKLTEDVDLYYTGELSHHEVLRLCEEGKSVVLCNHSNTERGYIREIMHNILTDAGLQCEVSDTDCDPLHTV
ncbi:HGR093Cp [Eremothecium sinecaudum]|uniref:HGR093Cp n=1 Tax=Eremothecium sinecaudum TaxID=45286 RepID=A0A0X8HVS4_9SACH|nr:HGR093Cp [Eremothecium sinecaudum]AMD22432.1 HGR093Cp [Eremothecium sinecaudum]